MTEENVLVLIKCRFMSISLSGNSVFIINLSGSAFFLEFSGTAFFLEFNETEMSWLEIANLFCQFVLPVILNSRKGKKNAVL